MPDDMMAQELIVEAVALVMTEPGMHQLFTRDICEAGWPGTGDHDHRPCGILGVTVGEFSSLALAFDGHKPHPGASTQARMEHALNAGKARFRVHRRDGDDAYEVHRVS